MGVQQKEISIQMYNSMKMRDFLVVATLLIFFVVMIHNNTTLQSFRMDIVREMNSLHKHISKNVEKKQKTTQKVTIAPTVTEPPKKDLNPLDGCVHVYLDVGSNVGVQVRKLFEPNLYPDAYILSYFDEWYGKYDNVTKKRPEKICAVGFEPNPSHVKRLQAIEKAYNKCGYSTKFFTKTAVSNKDGLAKFFTDEAMEHLEWGAGIVQSNNNLQSPKGKVKTLKLARYILETVATRSIPEGIAADTPTVFMKMDIEGSEIEVMSDMLVSGAMSHVKQAVIEWHPNLAGTEERRALSYDLSKSLEMLGRLTNQYSLVPVDDETYMNSDFELPNC